MGSRTSELEAGTIDRLAGHNVWATRVLLERCRGLTPEQFTRSFDIGPGRLHDTLLHVAGAMRRWADRIGDRPLRPSVEQENRVRTPDEILALLNEAEADLSGVLGRVVEEGRLDETMSITIPRYQEPFVFTRGTAIVHVMTHGVHHRAQAINMLRRLGLADLPDLDAIEWELAGGTGRRRA